MALVDGDETGGDDSIMGRRILVVVGRAAVVVEGAIIIVRKAPAAGTEGLAIRGIVVGVVSFVLAGASVVSLNVVVAVCVVFFSSFALICASLSSSRMAIGWDADLPMSKPSLTLRFFKGDAELQVVVAVVVVAAMV